MTQPVNVSLLADEVRAAGLAGLPVSWGPDGSFAGLESLPADQRAAFDAVVSAHDPDRVSASDIAALLRRIDGAFLSRLAPGIAYDGRRFQVAPADRDEITGILEGARNGVARYGGWAGMNAPNVMDVENGPYVIADFDDLVAWSTDLFALAAPLYSAWYAHRHAARALQTGAALAAYDLGAGWPS